MNRLFLQDNNFFKIKWKINNKVLSKLLSKLKFQTRKVCCNKLMKNGKIYQNKKY